MRRSVPRFPALFSSGRLWYVRGTTKPFSSRGSAESFPRPSRRSRSISPGPRGPSTTFLSAESEKRHTRVEGKHTFASKRPYWARVTSSGPKRTLFSGPKLAGKKGPEASASDKEVVFCYNNDYSFKLSRNDAASQYAITSFDKNIGGEPPAPFKVQVDGRVYEYLDAPFSFSAAYQPLSRIISSDRFTIQPHFGNPQRR